MLIIVCGKGVGKNMVIQRTSGRVIFNFFNTILLCGIGIVTLYPFIYVASASMSDSWHIIRGEVFLFPKGFTLEAYKRVLNFPMIWTAYKNTIMYTSVGTALNIVLTALGAYALSRPKFYGRRFFSLMIMVTMLFKAGMIPTFLVVKQLGLYNKFWVMIFPTAVSAWNLFVMKAFFEQIPIELEESATIDGCSDFGILFKIVFPLSVPSILTIGLFYAVYHWNSFFQALIYLKDSEKYPLQVMLRQIIMINDMQDELTEGDNVFSEAIKYAVIMVATLPILMVYPFIQKYFVKGVMIGAVKG